MCFNTTTYRDALKSMMADSEASLDDLASRLEDIADLLDECPNRPVEPQARHPSGLPQPRDDEAGATLEDETLFIIAIDEFSVLIALVIYYCKGWSHTIVSMPLITLSWNVG